MTALAKQQKFCAFTGKVKHPNRKEAIRALARVLRQSGRRGEVRVYHCRRCGGWHWGHL